MTVRVRFAPSPTGFLHVGGARTALFNWLWARHNQGTFILRIEDTDLERSTQESTDQILESMKWLGLDWDEGPFFQSQRSELYRENLEKLIASGYAYRAFETPEELDAMRAKAQAEGRNPIYDRRSLRLSPEEIQANIDAGKPFVWRFKCPEGETVVPETLMKGDSGCKFDNESLGDFALTRSGTEDNWGAPLFNFCCAIDDADMGITHVIRGADHLSNTPRQMMVLRALGFDVPTYTHLPLIMKGGKKMSKRDADADPRTPVSVSARRDLGYLRESTMNFLAMLGWSFDDKTEIFSVPELIEKFSLDGLSKANANFDEDKYLFLNGWYIRNRPAAEVVELVKPFLEAAGFTASERGDDWLANVIGLEIERCKLLSEFPEALEYFFHAPETYEEKGVKKLFAKDGGGEILSAAGKCLAETEDFTHEGLEAALRALGEKMELGFGKIAQPIRLAVTGRMASPGLFDVLMALGRDECVTRIELAAQRVAEGAILTT